MKPNDLKNVLKKLGLSTQGNKKELIKRVESSLQGWRAKIIYMYNISEMMQHERKDIL